MGAQVEKQGPYHKKRKMPSVSIIIPAWNEERTLKATLHALLEIDYDKKRCEVIVVAGGSDNTYEIAKSLLQTMEPFSGYIVLHQQPAGKNAAIQRGIIEAKNAIIVLLDADTIVTNQWLENMVEPIEQGKTDLTIANPEPVRKNWVSDYYMITKTYFLHSITTFSGHSMAFKASIVEERRGYFFDEDIKVGVDYLLAKRFLEQGQRIRFAKDARVITHLPSSLKYFVLCELRWITALINIQGVSYRALASNTVVVAALLFALPLSKTLFMLSALFNTLYIIKRVRMFVIASRHYTTSVRNIFGFLILSYTYHVIGLISHVNYFLGLRRGGHLYQGQRYN
jgi:cellulose synthase/poly-beta-1,6-N-acetylglucosamine synthase-like glycosyltransferase